MPASLAPPSRSKAHCPAAMLALLGLLLAWGAAGAPGKGGGLPRAAASWDEVNVLAHGLLQLGHGLKEHVERTGAQLRELGGRLRAHNASLGRLQRAADEQRQQLGRARRLLDARLDALDARLRALGGELAAQQRRQQQRLDGGGPAQPQAQPQLQLQRRPAAENASDGPRGSGLQAEQVGALQNQMNWQNLRIEELFQKIKQQQYRMDKQNLQIKSLQSKVNMLIPLHVKENENPNPSWKANAPRTVDQGVNSSQNARPNSPEMLEIPTNYHKLFFEGWQSSGIVPLQLPGSQPFEVFYDATPDSGGWIVIQRRLDGSVDFDQRWEAYRNGFGNMSGDFWLGLEKVHQIMREDRFHLLIELQDWEGNVEKVQYLFTLGGEDTAYTLSLLGPIVGELENAMGDFPQLPFSTRDQDHDLKGDTNCAKHLSGGWWFSGCGHVNLNGKYFRSIPRQRHERKQGVFWKTWKGRYYPLKATTMKIRPADLGPGS